MTDQRYFPQLFGTPMHVCVCSLGQSAHTQEGQPRSAPHMPVRSSIWEQVPLLPGVHSYSPPGTEKGQAPDHTEKSSLQPLAPTLGQMLPLGKEHRSPPARHTQQSLSPSAAGTT